MMVDDTSLMLQWKSLSSKGSGRWYIIPRHPDFWTLSIISY